MRLNAIPTTICGIPSQIWCLSPFWSFGLYRFHSYNSCRYRTFLRLGAHRHLCRQLAKQHAADAAGLQAAAKEAQKREVATLVDAQAHVAATYADARAAEDDAMIAATASALESGCEVERALQCKHDLKVCLEQEVVAAHARCAPPPLDRKNHQENHDADYEDATIGQSPTSMRRWPQSKTSRRQSPSPPISGRRTTSGVATSYSCSAGIHSRIMCSPTPPPSTSLSGITWIAPSYHGSPTALCQTSWRPSMSVAEPQLALPG
jgi:hypothetical protein